VRLLASRVQHILERRHQVVSDRSWVKSVPHCLLALVLWRVRYHHDGDIKWPEVLAVAPGQQQVLTVVVTGW
jgi:hypothetical protein